MAVGAVCEYPHDVGQALSLLPLREWSLTRRLQVWLFGSPITAAASPLLPSHAEPFFLGACRMLLLSPPAEALKSLGWPEPRYM